MTPVQMFAKRSRDGQQFVLGAGEDLDEVQASGEWIATDCATEVRR